MDRVLNKVLFDLPGGGDDVTLEIVGVNNSKVVNCDDDGSDVKMGVTATSDLDSFLKVVCGSNTPVRLASMRYLPRNEIGKKKKKK